MIHRYSPPQVHSARFPRIVVLTWLCLLQVAIAAPNITVIPPGLIGTTITFADGSTTFLRARDYFRPVALGPSEAITIEFRLPPSFANQPAVAQALDGGQLSAQDITISAAGAASLGFRAGSGPGTYRLLLSARGRSATLQFTVAALP